MPLICSKKQIISSTVWACFIKQWQLVALEEEVISAL